MTWTALPAAWREAAFQQDGAVLLESSLASETRSYLFTDPERILVANTAEDLPGLFEKVEEASGNGRWIAGYLAYDAGTHFVDLPSGPTGQPLAVFGIYGTPRIFDHTVTATNEPEPQPELLPIAPMLRIRREDYIAAINRIQQWIAAGETYQVNFTTHATSHYTGDAATLYDALRTQQPCGYGAVLRLQAERTILSFSPELFLRAAPDGTLKTKPMKGTAPRGVTAVDDEARSEDLRHDEKNRAEHIMIVDLLRNDLGRICRPGSVQVERLFDVERYPTLLQMTSTITGRMPPAMRWYDVFRALFPSGSITGAPKRHTMELISQTEGHARGVYTGTIGYFAPDRSATFSVAIRTAVVDGKTIEMGVGGGIVADSTASAEYDEALLKTAFLQRAAQPVELIETMLAEHGCIALLDRHMQRLAGSAAALGFAYDEQQIRHAIAQTVNQARQRVGLSLQRSGVCLLQSAEAPAWEAEPSVCLASAHLESDAPHLRHKTSFRPEYEVQLQAAQGSGFHEAIFLNQRGEFADGCISSLLVSLDGQWFTPPLSSGCLPGVYRAALLAKGLVTERTVTLDDLFQATHVCLCNAVRGVGNVTSLHFASNSVVRYAAASQPPRLRRHG